MARKGRHQIETDKPRASQSPQHGGPQGSLPGTKGSRALCKPWEQGWGGETVGFCHPCHQAGPRAPSLGPAQATAPATARSPGAGQPAVCLGDPGRRLRPHPTTGNLGTCLGSPAWSAPGRACSYLQEGPRWWCSKAGHTRLAAAACPAAWLRAEGAGACGQGCAGELLSRSFQLNNGRRSKRSDAGRVTSETAFKFAMKI